MMKPAIALLYSHIYTPGIKVKPGNVTEKCHTGI